MPVLEQDRAATPRRRVPWWPAALILGVVALVIGGYALYRVVQPARADVVWSDGFDGAAGAPPSDRNWLFTTGTSYPGGAAQFGTGEVQTYTDDREHARLDGKGHLLITATKDASGAWRSARIESRRTDFQPKPGGTLEVSARIKVPTLQPGYWPAFWMLGEPFRGTYTNWPGIGEIDILETVGRFPNTVLGTMHCGTAPGGPCKENDGISGKYSLPGGKSISADFHTYAVQWDRSKTPNEIRWYFDGHRFHTVRADAVDAQTWANATDHGYFILLNLAIGGALPGPADVTTKPGGALVVDEVTVSRP